MQRNFFCILIAACFLSLLMAFSQEAGNDSARVKFSGINVPVTLQPGRTSDIVLHFVIASGFHINSSAPKSDLLIPTRLKIDSDGAITSKKISYPEGKDLSLPFDPDSKLSVYSGDFAIHALLLAPAKAAAGTSSVHGELHFQACSDRACFPPKTLPFAFDVTVAAR